MECRRSRVRGRVFGSQSVEFMWCRMFRVWVWGLQGVGISIRFMFYGASGSMCFRLEQGLASGGVKDSDIQV